MQECAIKSTERLFEEDAYATEGEAEVVDVTSRGIVLDRTLFYAESGGQPGDTDWITWNGGSGAGLRISDAQYLPGKVRIVHQVDGAVMPRQGQTIRFGIDWRRRYRHMCMHTCLHVLCGLINAPVTGCSIHAERGRLDFDLPESIYSREELDRVLQEEIANQRRVSHFWRTGAEVAEALKQVRTVKLPPATEERLRLVEIDGLDVQPCGGTHVRNTGELKGLHVAKIEKKSRHNRRITIRDYVG